PPTHLSFLFSSTSATTRSFVGIQDGTARGRHSGLDEVQGAGEGVPRDSLLLLPHFPIHAFLPILIARVWRRRPGGCASCTRSSCNISFGPLPAKEVRRFTMASQILFLDSRAGTRLPLIFIGIGVCSDVDFDCYLDSCGRWGELVLRMVDLCLKVCRADAAGVTGHHWRGRGQVGVVPEPALPRRPRRGGSTTHSGFLAEHDV
ncbi:unnamed protein product, partial [Urochloa humidicola]